MHLLPYDYLIYTTQYHMKIIWVLSGQYLGIVEQTHRGCRHVCAILFLLLIFGKLMLFCKNCMAERTSALRAVYAHALFNVGLIYLTKSNPAFF